VGLIEKRWPTAQSLTILSSSPIWEMPGFKRGIYRARHFGLALLLTLLALLPLEQGFHYEIAVGDGL
jgi:hypothetical protein